MSTEKERYDHAKTELEMQELWDATQVYAFNEHDKKPLFSIDTPPPTVSGSLHIGHIFSYTHTDIIARFKRMRGNNVFYPMGFDDNGLPTERFVEKKLGIKGANLKRSDFIQRCLEESHKVEKTFEALWKSIGLSIDWKLLYSTIDEQSRRISQYSFIDLYKKNKVSRKAEPSLYCTTCQTSVAQAELDSAEVATQFNTIRFNDASGKELLIATTRPELLPACVAVFFHPDDARYKHLAQSTAIIPLFDKTVPIMPDVAVDPAKGTGLVMCCTFGDQTDIAWYKKHKLPFVQAVGRDGKWRPETGPLAGLNAIDARKKVIELLRDAGALVEQKSIKHHVATHERCKQEIEYFILHQWFVNILDHKQDFIDMGDQVTWYPNFMKARYKDWVENLNWDWCISRQRFYGIPFPVWHCNACHEVLLADEKSLPIDPQETNYPGGACTKCASSDIVGETDVMDTWNTSSLTPQINVGWPFKKNIPLPMSMRPQAHDIIRTWAFDTIVKAFYHHGMIPWNDIVISGHVLAGKEKISKSKENSTTSPEALIAKFPADAIRFWTAHGRLGTDTALSENQLSVGSRTITKLWNAFKFCKTHLQAHVPTSHVPPLDTLNKWLLHHLAQTVAKAIEHFERYEYHQALELVEKFFWNNFCDNYLELIKDQIFNPVKHSPEALEGTRYTLYEAGFGILQLYAPVLCHITESIYQDLYKGHEKTVSLHTTLLDCDRWKMHAYDAEAQQFDRILDIISSVRKLKSEHRLSLKSPIETIAIHTNDASFAMLVKDHALLLQGVCHTPAIVCMTTNISESTLITTDDKHRISIRI